MEKGRVRGLVSRGAAEHLGKVELCSQKLDLSCCFCHPDLTILGKDKTRHAFISCIKLLLQIYQTYKQLHGAWNLSTYYSSGQASIHFVLEEQDML